MRFGLLSKLALPAILLAITGLLITTLIGYTKSKTAIEDVIRQQQLQAVDSIERNVRFWIDSRRLEVTGWAQSTIYQNALEDSFLGKTARKAAGQRLLQDKQTYQVYRFIAITNLAGEVLAGSDDTAETTITDLLKTNGFAMAKAGSFATNHAIKDNTEGAPISVLYVPIKTKEQVAGVMIAVLDLNSFGSEFIVPLKSGQTGQAQVFRKDGALILTSNDTAAFTANIGELHIPASSLAQKRGTLTYQKADNVYMAAYRHIDELGWSALVSAQEAEVLASAREARLISLLASGLMALIIGFGVFVVVRKVLQPIRLTVAGLQDLSQGNGDLTKRLAQRSRDEVGELARFFNLFVEKLHEVIVKVKDSTLQVTNASHNLAQVTDKTEKSLARQRSEIDMIASAVDEMSATARAVAANATEAADFARQVDKEANSGSQVVSKTIGAIDTLANEVETSANVVIALRNESESIGTVLDVIKGIAEQTNLLALNAAIEAARAGEMGRGFAVVADEVRTLAQRTQTSTREIEQMIDSLQSKAEQASQSIQSSRKQAQSTVDQAKEAGAALESITKAVVNITDMNHQIASAAEEQSAVTEEITRNVNNILEVTGETAKIAAQTHDASIDLNQSSDELNKVVAQFKV